MPLFIVAHLDSDLCYWMSATRRLFATRAGAERYALTVNPAYQPFIIETRSEYLPGYALHPYA